MAGMPLGYYVKHENSVGKWVLVKERWGSQKGISPKIIITIVCVKCIPKPKSPGT